ncbi:uncharacterized protein [Chelonus insularis]|nr:uncharacterized protein LOC118068970 isoform X2 [Chelonus insularis]
MQNFIYPGFNVVRKLAVPIITRYPHLTELYDESCLVENPFFHVLEMDCWPCNGIRSVPNLTGINITKNFNTGIPFTRFENDTNTDMTSIVDTYYNHQEVFISDALKVTSNNLEYRTISDVINKQLNKYPSNLKNTHISWRITRVKPGRILRKLFPKLSGTPDWWSQSVERFLLIDEPNASIYNLPNPECSNVILRATSGKRLIKLIPSLECQYNCRTNAVVLSAGHSLWYNWWYWRPISQPVINSTEISVQYLTSFC